MAVVVLAELQAYRQFLWVAIGLVGGLLAGVAALPWQRLVQQGEAADQPAGVVARVVRLMTPVSRMMASARTFLSPGVLLAGLALGLVAWGAEAVGLKLLCDIIAPDKVTVAGAMGIYAIAIIVGALSFLPGGLGSTEAVMAALLYAHGYTMPQAILLTLICRVLTLWLAVLIVSVYAAAAAGGGVAVTNAVMDTAPAGKDGAASAFRGAAAGLGTAIGVAGMTSIVILASSASLHNQSVRAGIDPSQSTQIARDMAQGATSEDASSLYAVPVAEVTEIDDLRRRAYLEGFKAHGLVGGAVTLAAGVMFFVVRRRQERRSQDVDRIRDDKGAQGQ